MTACPECGSPTPCTKCAAGLTPCLTPTECDKAAGCFVCHVTTCFVYDADGEPEPCPDCTETSRCPACADDFNYHHDKDER